MEESKKKLQNAHNYSTVSNCHSSSSSSAAATANPTSNVNIHQSLPSLSSTSEISLDSTHKLPIDGNSLDSSSTDEPNLSLNSLDSSQQSFKIESDSSKLVETRRNSRSDPKNFGRFFTADGTSVTHSSNPSTTSINPSSSKSTAIIKRLSWTNEPSTKSDLSTTIPTNELSNTNSFRSVHSSSGVSSTGSFLFSGDDEPTTAIASSLPAVLSSNTTTTTITTTNNPIDDLIDDIDEFDGKSSSSTVIGTDDHEHSLNLQTSIDLENLNNRLSTASTSTLTSSTTIPIVHTQSSSPEMSLRRTPFASVKKRNPNPTNIRTHLAQTQPTSSRRQHRVFDENDLRSSTHTVVYDSSKTTTLPTNISVRRIVLPSDDSTNGNLSPLTGSGNESDYDNNQISTNNYSKTTMKFPSNPVNDLRPDDLVLGDQNEIVLTTDLQRNLPDEHRFETDERTFQSTNLNQQQSDNQQISTSINSVQSTTTTTTANHRISIKPNSNSSPLDDSAPTYRKDYVTAKKLYDIKSQLLLNTTLDAT